MVRVYARILPEAVRFSIRNAHVAVSELVDI